MHDSTKFNIVFFFTEHVDNRMLITGNVTAVRHVLRLQAEQTLSSYGRELRLSLIC
jgi:hypothetical protein